MFDPKVYKMLGFFCDNREHSFVEVMNLSAVTFKRPWRESEAFFKRWLLENGLVDRSWQEPFFQMDNYKLSSKGDECYRDFKLRQAIIDREQGAWRHYKYFDRTSSDKWADTQKVSEKDAKHFMPHFGSGYYNTAEDVLNKGND